MQKVAIHLIIAARPNIMKVAPLYHQLIKSTWAIPILVHTGQHYDDNMSGTFLRTLNMPEPSFHLNVSGGTNAYQTGQTMIAYDELCQKNKPDLTIVVGDVNATIACALTAKKRGIPVGHVEAGLRSFDPTMPEEINRLATDSISDWYWTPSVDATKRLQKEGVENKKIVEVGNLMIDSFCLMQNEIMKNKITETLQLMNKDYGVVTFHRPANVDSSNQLEKIVNEVIKISGALKLVFPVHPRTKKRLIEFKLYDKLATSENILLIEPQPYLAFMNLVRTAKVIITDSGGIQEETTYIGVPCLTLRENTERPVTITLGTNQLVSVDTVYDKVKATLMAPSPKKCFIPGWDGKASERLFQHLEQIFAEKLK